MAILTALPGIAPSVRTFQVDRYPQQAARMRGGRTLRWAQANSGAQAGLELEWAALTNADAELLLKVWDASYGLYGDVDLALETVAGLSPELVSLLRSPSAGTTWRFERPPEVELLKRGRCTVRMQLTSRRVSALTIPAAASYTLDERVPCCAVGGSSSDEGIAFCWSDLCLPGQPNNPYISGETAKRTLWSGSGSASVLMPEHIPAEANAPLQEPPVYRSGQPLPGPAANKYGNWTFASSPNDIISGPTIVETIPVGPFQTNYRVEFVIRYRVANGPQVKRQSELRTLLPAGGEKGVFIRVVDSFASDTNIAQVDTTQQYYVVSIFDPTAADPEATRQYNPITYEKANYIIMGTGTNVAYVVGVSQDSSLPQSPNVIFKGQDLPEGYHWTKTGEGTAAVSNRDTSVYLVDKDQIKQITPSTALNNNLLAAFPPESQGPGNRLSPSSPVFSPIFDIGIDYDYYAIRSYGYAQSHNIYNTNTFALEGYSFSEAGPIARGWFGPAYGSCLSTPAIFDIFTAQQFSNNFETSDPSGYATSSTRNFYAAQGIPNLMVIDTDNSRNGTIRFRSAPLGLASDAEDFWNIGNASVFSLTANPSFPPLAYSYSPVTKPPDIAAPSGDGYESAVPTYSAWDWGDPSYCQQKLLDLGFSPGDLAFP